VIDPQKHRDHTGVDNAAILANLRQLSAAGTDIIIRIPLVPGVNDSLADLDAAGEFVSGLPRRHPVHLLPYHRAASGKYRKLGLNYRGQDIAPLPADRVADAARRLSRFGLKVEIGG
jgi:pyruvate formate lyase activating enzyme